MEVFGGKGGSWVLEKVDGFWREKKVERGLSLFVMTI
jgi:hypothetical protein